MAENTKIEWATHTFNPWRGCTKISAGCANCYADTLSKRNPGVLGIWGPQGTRVVASESQWKEPLKWEREASEWDRICLPCNNRIRRYTGSTKTYGCFGCGNQNLAPNRPRVFCASLADVFEDWKGPIKSPKGGVARKDTSGNWILECGGITRNDFPLTMEDVRKRLFELIDETPNLDWMLLTKRPENIARMMPKLTTNNVSQMSAAALECGALCEDVDTPRPNVWLGTSAENQQALDERVPHLLNVPAKVRFLSCEPLLGPLDLSRWLRPHCPWGCGEITTKGGGCNMCEWIAEEPFIPINWVIVGGESGPDARQCHIDWIRDIVKQCKAAGVPVFVKHVGSRPYEMASNGHAVRSWGDAKILVNGEFVQIYLADKKGGDMAEWAVDLRVREFPEVIR